MVQFKNIHYRHLSKDIFINIITNIIYYLSIGHDIFYLKFKANLCQNII
jgi:hypothetical protein